MALELDAIPILDNHCHSLLRAQPQDDAAFRIHLTESYYPEIARDHVPHSLFYLWAIRELAAFLGCEPTPDAVHATRRERGVERLTREIVQRANFRGWLVDTGYGTDTTLSLDELRGFVPCDIRAAERGQKELGDLEGDAGPGEASVRIAAVPALRVDDRHGGRHRRMASGRRTAHVTDTPMCGDR